jgi:pimeloyl-ACP methyl ester carboxylesterase
MFRIVLSMLVMLAVAGCASAPQAPTVPPVHLTANGTDEPVVLFIHGNGASSAAWEPVEGHVERLGVTTVNLDRPGLGQSPPGPRPYRIEDEATAIEETLREARIEGPFILVAHSYGGLIAFLLAERLEDVEGLVLVDAVIPGELTPPQVDEILAIYRPQYDLVREQAPALAEAVIPVVEALPATARNTEALTLPQGLPVIDIRAETGDAASEATAEAVMAHHRQFVTSGANRRLVVAEGSGHQVMNDRPDVVIEAIAGLVGERAAAD